MLSCPECGSSDVESAGDRMMLCTDCGFTATSIIFGDDDVTEEGWEFLDGHFAGVHENDEED